jgi:hypothetical protein
LIYKETPEGGELMRKWILLIVLIVIAFYAATLRFTVVSNRATDGTYHVILVDKTSGKLYQLMGK